MLQFGTINIEYVFYDEPVDGQHGYLFPRAPVYFLALEAVAEPGPRDEVNCLAYVDPRGEPAMVRPREGHYVLAWHLQSLVDLHLLLLEVARVNHRVYVQQDVRVLLE